MKGTVDIELPEKISTNSFYRLHHMKRYPLVQQVYIAVQEAVRRARIAPVLDYPVEMTYAFKIPGNPLDNLNLSAMAKMLEDGLRHAGVLEEDTPAHVSRVTLYQERAKDKRTSVTVSWAEPPAAAPVALASRNAGSKRPRARRQSAA